MIEDTPQQKAVLLKVMEKAAELQLASAAALRHGLQSCDPAKESPMYTPRNVDDVYWAAGRLHKAMSQLVEVTGQLYTDKHPRPRNDLWRVDGGVL